VGLHRDLLRGRGSGCLAATSRALLARRVFAGHSPRVAVAQTSSRARAEGIGNGLMGRCRGRPLCRRFALITEPLRHLRPLFTREQRQHVEGLCSLFLGLS
jgi:hypothetical protein